MHFQDSYNQCLFQTQDPVERRRLLSVFVEYFWDIIFGPSKKTLSSVSNALRILQELLMVCKRGSGVMEKNLAPIYSNCKRYFLLRILVKTWTTHCRGYYERFLKLSSSLPLESSWSLAQETKNIIPVPACNSTPRWVCLSGEAKVVKHISPNLWSS